MSEILKNERYYTYKEWLELADCEQTELIDGIVYKRGEPTRKHQKISRELSRQISNFLLGKTCELYYAPFAVRLFSEEDTVLQPDLVVICDADKLTDLGCNGAPDLIIEILSPSTAGNDWIKKYNKYLRAEVKEYWIVDPEMKIVFVHILKDNIYEQSRYTGFGILQIQTLPGCEVDLSLVFLE